MALSTTVTESVGAEPAPSRDPIGFVLFFRMDWCERRPGLMLACLGAVVVAASLLEKVLP